MGKFVGVAKTGELDSGQGKLIEVDKTEVIFSDQPKDRLTYEYVQGIFG